MALILDIETIGANFDELNETTRDSLTRWIKRESGDDSGKYNVMLEDLKEGLGFSPLTGEIVAIGVFDTEKKKGVVYYNGQEEQDLSDDKFIFKSMSEKNMLENFWQGARYYNKFVTFNGRAFDIPFLMIRSAIHKVKPTKNLMASRYLSQGIFGVQHIDLLDQLSFYGAVRRRGNLHLYCNAFGIKSPKAKGITGDDVSHLFREGKRKEIAEYNSWDLLATAELYKIWEDYIRQ